MVAAALGGQAWQSGGSIWLFLLRQGNGKLVAVSDEVICEYSNQTEFDMCKPHQSILLH